MEPKRKEKIFHDQYLKLAKIGRGAYGEVYLVEDSKVKQDNSEGKVQQIIPKNWCAIKSLKFEKENQTTDGTSIREVKILKEIHHPNIINIHNFFYHSDSFAAYKESAFIAMDYVPFELSEDIIDNQDIILSEDDIISIIYQIGQAISFLHNKKIMHRDICPRNILVDIDGNIKLTDFGLSRFLSPEDSLLTRNVITKYYRPPEIFYGTQQYDFAVDVWSFGCVIAEMFLREPLFRGNTEIEMLARIFEVLGTPNYQNSTEILNEWPGVADLPWYLQINPCRPKMLEKVIPNASRAALNLIHSILQLNPAKRPSMEDVLQHEFFKNVSNLASKGFHLKLEALFAKKKDKLFKYKKTFQYQQKQVS